MITRQQHERAKSKAADLIRRSGLAVRPAEIEAMETPDFGLGELEQSGCQTVTLVDTGQIAIKVIVLLPGQTLPEHHHPTLGGHPGKEETVRCAWGELYVFTPGERTETPSVLPPAHRHHTYTAWNEHRALPGEQVYLPPGTAHWLQGGPEGAVLWSFADKSVDLADVFSDPEVSRETKIQE